MFETNLTAGQLKTSWATLKTSWATLKKTSKASLSQDKIHGGKTGGGPRNPEISVIHAKVMAVVVHRMVPLGAQFDDNGDTAYFEGLEGVTGHVGVAACSPGQGDEEPFCIVEVAKPSPIPSSTLSISTPSTSTKPSGMSSLSARRWAGL